MLEKMCRKAAHGEIANYSSPEEDENEPARAAKWGPGRVVNAEHIGWLCTDPDAVALVTYRGVYIRGARIDGGLDLDFADVLFPLILYGFAFTGGIELRHAIIPALYMMETRVNSINADSVNGLNEVRCGDRGASRAEVRPSRTTGWCRPVMQSDLYFVLQCQHHHPR